MKTIRKYLAIPLITLLILMSISSLPTSISTEVQEEVGFPLRVTRIPEELVEHPERANDTHPTGTIVYIDTTNPHKDWFNGDPLDEWHINETHYNINIVLALDEEAIDKWGIDYAVRAVERADESFIHYFGKDFKVRAIVDWDSDDSIEWFNPDLYREAYGELSQYLGSYIDGHRNSIVIAISGQWTWDMDVVGLAPLYPVWEDNTLILCRFKTYFADDNIVKHEMAHMWNCDDHPEEEDLWCPMAYASDYVWILVEDGRPYDMFCNIPRGYMSYDWCDECYTIISYGAPLGYPSPEMLVITGRPFPV